MRIKGDREAKKKSERPLYRAVKRVPFLLLCTNRNNESIQQKKMDLCPSLRMEKEERIVKKTENRPASLFFRFHSQRMRVLFWITRLFMVHFRISMERTHESIEIHAPSGCCFFHWKENKPQKLSEFSIYYFTSFSFLLFFIVQQNCAFLRGGWRAMKAWNYIYTKDKY